MSKTARLIILGAFVLAAVIAVIVNKRLDYPRERPWWAGRNPVVRVQVWEPGKDLPTVSMTLPKRTLDQMVAFGFPPTISVGEGNRVEFGKVWHDLQRLPRGEKLRYADGEGALFLWIEPKGEPAAADSLPPGRPPRRTRPASRRPRRIRLAGRRPTPPRPPRRRSARRACEADACETR